MSQVGWQSVWDGIISIPVSGRIEKPRSHGLTMVMDKGLGLSGTAELLTVAGRYIDYFKLAFGTPALYEGELLKKKIALVRSNNINIYPGGTFLEIAIHQNRINEFLNRAWELGFTAIEVSDGTVPLTQNRRHQVIQMALDKGFCVVSEVGKKDPAQDPTAAEIISQIKLDLASGATAVIVEARESGKGIGIFNNSGEIKKDRFSELLNGLSDPAKVIWEAPLKSQQQELIMTFGPNVSLGNIAPAEVLALEALRLGLRGDTLKVLLENNGMECRQ